MLRLRRCAAATGLAVAFMTLAPIAVGGLAPVRVAAQDPAQELEDLIARWQKTEEDFFAQYQKAKTNEERRALMDKRPKAEDYLPGFVEIAEAAAGSDTAAKAWMWVLKLAPQADNKELPGVALEILLRDHVASPEIADLPGRIAGLSETLGDGKAEAALRDLMARAPKGPTKGGAMYALATLLDEDDLDPASQRGKEVRELMETVAKEYGDVKDGRGRSIGKRAEGWLFEKDHLQPGQPAPEIEGNDLSGVAFKLSDYRGKVVLLDFWGNW